jgi:hypothetical protein
MGAAAESDWEDVSGDGDWEDVASAPDTFRQRPPA